MQTVTLSNIETAIRHGRCRAQQKMHAIPMKLYVGRLQNRLLDAVINESRHSFGSVETGVFVRRTWEGMQVFIVDSEDYLDFGL